MNDGLESEHAAGKGGIGEMGCRRRDWLPYRQVKQCPRKGPDGLEAGRICRCRGILLVETWGELSVGWGFLDGFGDTPVRARILPVNWNVCEVDFNVIS